MRAIPEHRTGAKGITTLSFTYQNTFLGLALLISPALRAKASFLTPSLILFLASFLTSFLTSSLSVSFEAHPESPNPNSREYAFSLVVNNKNQKQRQERKRKNKEKKNTLPSDVSLSPCNLKPRRQLLKTFSSSSQPSPKPHSQPSSSPKWSLAYACPPS